MPLGKDRLWLVRWKPAEASLLPVKSQRNPGLPAPLQLAYPNAMIAEAIKPVIAKQRFQFPPRFGCQASDQHESPWPMSALMSWKPK
jgi:hypothetical protein